MIYKYYTIKIFAISIFFLSFYSILFTMIFDVIIMITFFILIMLTMKKFIEKTNEIILNINCPNKLFQSNINILNSIRKFIMLHNHYSTIMYKINYLYSRLLLACLLLCMPANLIIINFSLFENTALEVKLLISCLAFNISGLMIILLYVLAYLSKESHRTTIHLSRLQWRINGQPFGLRHKIKLMSYFERLSSNRKIGITIGPTVTLTMNIFFQVIFQNKINNR